MTFAEVGQALRLLNEEWEARVHARAHELGAHVSRWKSPDRAAVARALSELEDWLELERPRFERGPLRDVRRRLEETLT